MKNVRWHSFLWILSVLMFVAGCNGTSRTRRRQSLRQPNGIAAIYADSRVVVDGWLDESIWTQAKTYPLSLAKDQATKGSTEQEADPEMQAREAGSVRLVWNDQYLFIAVEFEDLDITAEGQSDQLEHFKFGDVCRVFLKPEDQTWYWELQVTPHSRMSSFWYPGRGRVGLPSNFQYTSGLRVAAKVDGTMNNWRDKDRKWTAELAMPLRDLTAHGETFGPDSLWRIHVARYNYSRYRDDRGPERTTMPRLLTTYGYSLEPYVRLRLMR